ncbi:SEC-C metal-binding domain-containing protein [Bacillus cereus]|uniref:SEC-C metal-binding domain-containing protein n=1 Tax=Bacillus cereus TaxID=1396 RepID=UPI000279D9ED|nr:SEC-C metal-binding domain-containing protein [Bacillus cereus]EJR72801.1 protein translocase subunit secA [Bacillus cereus VD166]
MEYRKNIDWLIQTINHDLNFDYKDLYEPTRNDECPCGSGVKYKKCHINSQVNWRKVDSIFYNGKTLYENIRLKEELLNTMLDIVMYLKENVRISEEKGIELIDVLFKSLDQVFKQLQKNAPCRKGCIACCFQPIKLATIEESRIRNIISEEIKKNIKNNYKETIKRSKIPISQINKDSSRIKYAEPCPLLDLENRKCTVYDERPFACRTYFVANAPDICNMYDGKVTIYKNQGYQELVEIVISLIDESVFGCFELKTLHETFYRKKTFFNKLKSIF